jgi:hypothetical protein
MTRYGGLKRATITVRDDGKLDVLRERETGGEVIKGCATLDEALDAIRAHAWPGQVRSKEQEKE